MDLDSKYNRFVGQTITPVVVGAGTDDKFSYTMADEKSPVYLELNAEAVADGFYLRVWFPHTIGTMDYRTDRINVRLNDDGLIESLRIG